MWVHVTLDGTSLRLRYLSRCVYVINQARTDTVTLRGLADTIVTRSWHECLVELVRSESIGCVVDVVGGYNVRPD